jgi:outer membrane lipoprotein-sorting protein
MKSILTAIASITILSGGANAAQFSFPQPPPHSPSSLSQATETLDLALLAKSITAFLKSDRYQTDSQTYFKVSSQGNETTIYLQNKIITQSGRKFRAEITYAKPGQTSQPGNLVVSDGKQLWIYRPDLKQYAVTTYTDFKNSDDWILLGLSPFAFLDFPQEDRKIVANGNLSAKNVLTYLNLSSNGEIQGATRTLEGETFYVYNYKDPKEGFILSAFINPKTAALKQLQLAGKSQNLDILLTEKILRRTPNPAVTSNTFKFTPPKGTKRVKSLSISPL